MDNMYNGLPRRTLFAHINGEPREFNVTTEIVQEIIAPILDGEELYSNGLNDRITKWDDQIAYYVPNGVFALENDKEVVSYIHNCIDDNVTNP